MIKKKKLSFVFPLNYEVLEEIVVETGKSLGPQLISFKSHQMWISHKWTQTYAPFYCEKLAKDQILEIYCDDFLTTKYPPNPDECYATVFGHYVDGILDHTYVWLDNPIKFSSSQIQKIHLNSDTSICECRRPH